MNSTEVGIGLGITIPVAFGLLSWWLGSRSLLANETKAYNDMLRMQRDDWRKQAEECYAQRLALMHEHAVETARVADATRAATLEASRADIDRAEGRTPTDGTR